MAGRPLGLRPTTISIEALFGILFCSTKRSLYSAIFSKRTVTYVLEAKRETSHVSLSSRHNLPCMLVDIFWSMLNTDRHKREAEQQMAGEDVEGFRA
jgi:hypothetical protein